MSVTRPCPVIDAEGKPCRSILQPVPGGLGRMGRCAKCGWTGPLYLTERELKGAK